MALFRRAESRVLAMEFDGRPPRAQEIRAKGDERVGLVDMIDRQVIATEADLVLVVGSPNSSNSVRLVEVAKDYGAPEAYLVDDAGEVEERWLAGVSTVGVTSGASVPEELVTAVLDKLAGFGFGTVEEVEAIEEHMTFALPRELRAGKAAKRV